MTHLKAIALRKTLSTAVQDALEGHWRGLRSYARAKSQVTIAVGYLESIGRTFVDEVTEADIIRLRDWSLASGLTPASVNCRMSTLSVLGIKVRYCRNPRKRKWYLAPQEERQIALLTLPPILQAFISWTVATGLRVEESLALRWADIDLEAGTVHVPGTKTDMAEATLPLSEEAKDVLLVWQAAGVGGAVFPVTYSSLRRQWEKARASLGLKDVETATLKSLRRSFARRAHVNGMPIDILRQYLRHGNLKTTQGYLWLVGGYSQDEMRRYLS